MDRSWISDPKSSQSYRKGIEEFLNFASQNALAVGKMDCPCSRCRNLERLKRGTVRKHLLKHGFDSDYTLWVCHGENDLTSGCFESTEKNNGDVDQGNASKSTEEDLKNLWKARMDRSWISDPKSSKSYRKGVEEFLNFASQNALAGGKMDCPCTRCRNLERLKRGMVRKHLLKHGFDSDYTRWVCHGENDLTSGCSELTEKNNGDVDPGNASKSTEEDSKNLWKARMDGGWISDPKSSQSYRKGIEDFLNFASQNALAAGKMDCPCSRCRCLERLKRDTVRKHLLKHGFNSDYTRWVCHGEIDLTSGCSESTEKNDGDVDRGNASKSTEEDLAGLPKHVKEELKDIEVKDQETDQKKVLVLEEVQDFGPKGKKIEHVAELTNQRLDDRKMLLFAHCLYKLRRKFGWDREPFDELINYLVNVFPLFHRLPICFNVVSNAFGFENLNLSNTERGHCSSLERINNVLEVSHFKCYACGQELKSYASTSTSSKRRNKKKKKKPFSRGL